MACKEIGENVYYPSKTDTAQYAQQMITMSECSVKVFAYLTTIFTPTDGKIKGKEESENEQREGRNKSNSYLVEDP